MRGHRSSPESSSDSNTPKRNTCASGVRMFMGFIPFPRAIPATGSSKRFFHNELASHIETSGESRAKPLTACVNDSRTSRNQADKRTDDYQAPAHFQFAHHPAHSHPRLVCCPLRQPEGGERWVHSLQHGSRPSQRRRAVSWVRSHLCHVAGGSNPTRITNNAFNHKAPAWSHCKKTWGKWSARP